jgi:ribonuclease D
LYITDDEGLHELIAEIRSAKTVGIDTEFMREKTYFAKLCLIQLATEEITAIVDPLTVTDISPLCGLLADPDVTKVVHAGGQDLEIFFRMCDGRSAAPVFDTQVAATLAGFPQQVGYGALVYDLLGIKLDKGDSYTDWSKRPLSDAQVAYALNDVRYLPAMYERLKSQLEKEGRTEWLSADFQRMEDPATYEIVPHEQWRRVKRISSLNRRQLAVAREVAAWRENEAIRRDIPKRWVIGDGSIVEVARRMPADVEELAAIRGVPDKVGKQASKGLLSAVAAGVDVPEEDLPVLSKRKRLNGDVEGAVDLMVALVRLRARQHGVAMPLLASRDDLERLAGGDRDSSPLLSGWRATMVGNELVELLDGSVTLSLAEGHLQVVKIMRDSC